MDGSNSEMVGLKWPNVNHWDHECINGVVFVEISHLNKEMSLSMVDLVLWVMKQDLLIPNWIDIFLHHQGLLNVVIFERSVLVLSNVTQVPAKLEIRTWESL
jgi:repressor of nif and glnA expression